MRGTQFDLSVETGVTKITLLEGEIVVCPRGRFDGDPRKLSKAQVKAYDCLDLTKSGQTAQIKNRSASFSKGPVDFASACSGAAGLCSVSTASGATPAAPTNAALDPNDPALCYASQGLTAGLRSGAARASIRRRL